MAARNGINNERVDILSVPMLKPVELMSKVSGIGENRLRQLMDTGEIEYIQTGNKRLLADCAIWDWYNRNKVTIIAGKE